MEEHDYICGDQFSAVDCIMGPNILWAQAYGLCQDDVFSDYMSRLSARPAFAQAYSDLADFSLDIPEEKRAAWQEEFTG
jgi:glutathione S-transferase